MDAIAVSKTKRHVRWYQKHLADIFEIKDTKYPDLIAELCLNIQDDLCVMESSDEQRLIAASICSPSYWDVRTKIGRPLEEIHDPVVSLDKKIGDNCISAQPYRENMIFSGHDPA